MPPFPSINKDSLSQHLANVDINDSRALRTFVTILRDTCAPTPSIPTSSLTIIEVFKLFRFTNEIERRFNAEIPYILNNFRVDADPTLERTRPRHWLEQTLEYMGNTLTSQEGVSRHTFIKMLLAATLQELPGTTPPLRISCGMTLNCYMKSLSALDPTYISGTCDLVIGYETQGVQGRNTDFEPYMVIMEASADGALETVFAQLLAHMGMLQAGRTAAGLAVVPVFGAISDGYKYTFVRLGRTGRVTRTPDISIIQKFGSVYTVAVRILTAVQNISVAASALKPRLLQSAQPSEAPSRAESKPFDLEIQEAFYDEANPNMI